MLTFKQYLAEMAGAETPQKRETMIVKALQSHSNTNPISINVPDSKTLGIKDWGYSANTPGPLPTMVYSANTSYNDYANKAEAVSQFTHHVVSTLSKINPKSYTHTTKDTRGDINKLSIRKENNIDDISGGRPVEDAMISNGDKAVALDIKVGMGPSAWNPRPSTTNYRLSEFLNPKMYSKFMRYYRISKKLQDKDRKRIAKGLMMKSAILPYEDDPVNKYENRQAVLKRIINGLELSDTDSKNFVHRVMNVHEVIPDHMKRLQLLDSAKKTEIYDYDHAWKYFQQQFPDAKYSFEMENRGKTGKPDRTSSFKIIATDKRDGKRKIHIATFSMGSEKGGSPLLKYNVKHHFIKNLVSKYGYTPLAVLEHPGQKEPVKPKPKKVKKIKPKRTK